MFFLPPPPIPSREKSLLFIHCRFTNSKNLQWEIGRQGLGFDTIPFFVIPVFSDWPFQPYPETVAPDGCSRMTKKGKVKHLMEGTSSVGQERLQGLLVPQFTAHLTSRLFLFLSQPLLPSQEYRVNTAEQRRVRKLMVFLCAKKHEDFGKGCLSPVDLPWQPPICYFFIFQVLV